MDQTYPDRPRGSHADRFSTTLVRDLSSIACTSDQPEADARRHGCVTSRSRTPLVKWQLPKNGMDDSRPTIQIVAATVQDEAGRVLPVRKRGTRAFMQPGGKMQGSESHLAALGREIGEELRCSIAPDSSVFLGTFTAPAANENGCFAEAALYHIRLLGTANASTEIEEIIWLDPCEADHIELAPLTRNFVLPLAQSSFPDHRSSSYAAFHEITASFRQTLCRRLAFSRSSSADHWSGLLAPRLLHRKLAA